MNEVKMDHKDRTLKITAILVAIMIVISFTTLIRGIPRKSMDETKPNGTNQSFENQRFSSSSITAQSGLWIPLDSSPDGSPTETHVTISDTTGLTIVADFHGFWRGNYTSNVTEYDDIMMPGTGNLQDPGNPKLPCLFEYVEVPHAIDISIELLATTSTHFSDYNITPAVLEYPEATEYTPDSAGNASELFFSPVYSIDSEYPGNITSIEGEFSSTPWIVRGHRLVGLSFYPIQYNPVADNMTAYSQIMIRLKYSTPAQIQPIPVPLRSEAFETILAKTVLNYDAQNTLSNTNTGTATIENRDFTGAEYLIITTQEFEDQANELADWKERKGVPSEVILVDPGAGEQVRNAVVTAYNDWDLVPTYCLLIGDVEFIPASYSFQHRGHKAAGIPMFEQSYYWAVLVIYRVGDKGYIASDLGYFTIEGDDYLPEMIYGRLSVDTEQQAQTLVDKILNYEQSPPTDVNFYKDTLFAGDFNDRDSNNHLDGHEEVESPFLSYLETIRHYLSDRYEIHINYSCSLKHYDNLPDYDSSYIPSINLSDLDFSIPITNSLGQTSYLVTDSIDPDYPNFGWLFGYDGPPYSDLARGNITPNVNEGRFLLLYFGHGGSKNMIYPYEVSYNPPGTTPVYDRNDRDSVEGWQFPCFNTTFFPDLVNGDKTPLVISIACNTGWFDGETDEDVLILTSLGDPNPFEDYDNECFAENITRLEGGGAVAAISASRPVATVVGLHILYGLIQAFWPGITAGNNQPIYDMGTALLFSKLYTRQYVTEIIPFESVRTGFEAFNLFGDPETELWTEVPSQFDVTYPLSIGTSDPQRFVVTVQNETSGDPVKYAKVCIQQKVPGLPGIYQVGYTDKRGQAIFDVDPVGDPSHINVTVTKHNFRPHIGNITVHESNARISLSTQFAVEDDVISITFTNFPTDRNICIMLVHEKHQLLACVLPGTTVYNWQVFGLIGYVTIWVAAVWGDIEDWTPVSVDRLGITSVDAGPDPYIYSQDDPSTWGITGNQLTWDNPDIEVTGDTVTVTVHNRGADSTEPTDVALFYTPYGGGLTWHDIEEKTLPGVAGTVTFTPETLPQAACFIVVLSNAEEVGLENEINNVGYENLGYIEMNSPGEESFQIGNPTDSKDYIFIKVTQLGSYDDVWSASILEYSSQALEVDSTEEVMLSVESLANLEVGEWRLIRVDIFVNNTLVGGMIFNVTQGPGILDPFLLALIVGALVAVTMIAIVIIRRRK
ncbi:MAG: C25 family cysteine peptidase [Promethearchaeota archaeon]